MLGATMEQLLQRRRQDDETTPYHGPAYGKLAKRAIPVLVVLIIFEVLATVFVALRFYSRHLTRRRYFVYDWLILAALIIFWGYMIADFLTLFLGGTGWEIYDLGTAEVELALKINLALQVLYATSMGLVKISMCLMLMQIFPLRKFKIAAWIALVLSVGWAIMTVLVGFLICAPLSYLWDTSVPGGHCGSTNASFAAIAVVDIFIDVWIIIMPLPLVWGLQTQTVTKVALSGIFALGLVTIAMTCVRMDAVLTTDFDNFSYSSTNVFIWTCIEWATAIMVTCAPGMRPVLEKVVPRRWTRKYVNTNNTTAAATRDNNDDGRTGRTTGQPTDFGRNDNNIETLEQHSWVGTGGGGGGGGKDRRNFKRMKDESYGDAFEHDDFEGYNTDDLVLNRAQARLQRKGAGGGLGDKEEEAEGGSTSGASSWDLERGAGVDAEAGLAPRREYAVAMAPVGGGASGINVQTQWSVSRD